MRAPRVRRIASSAHRRGAYDPAVMVGRGGFDYPPGRGEGWLCRLGAVENRLRSLARMRPRDLLRPAAWPRWGAGAVPGARGLEGLESTAAGGAVVYLPALPWNYRVQRPQQLALALARGGRPVLYVDGFLRSRWQPVRSVAARHGRLTVLRLRVPGAPDLHRSLAQARAAAELGQVVLDGLSGLPVAMVLVQLPFWAPLGRVLASALGAPLVYDRIDLHTGFPGVPHEMAVAEEALMREADLVAATSEALEAWPRERELPTLRLPNAVDPAAFAERLPVPRPERPVVGYLGALAEWFDHRAVRYAAERRPEWRFRLAGRLESEAVAALAALPNVELTGEIAYSDLPAFHAGIDVAMVPFVDSPLTRAADPVKVYEALAAGLPVVARQLPETARWGEPEVTLYRAPEELVARLDEVLAAPLFATEAVRSRRRAVAGHTWDRRAADLVREVETRGQGAGRQTREAPRLAAVRAARPCFALSRATPIFVAGHRGLVGAALVRRLEAEGFGAVLAVGREEVDLREQDAVRRWFRRERPEVVLLAAGTVGGILDNARRPADYLYDNLMIHANVLAAASASGVRRLLYLGSSCIYPRDASQPIGEASLLSGPLEPTNEAYAVAKISGIKLCQAYRRQLGCDFLAAMPTNLYGPHDNFDPETAHVLPALLRRFHEAKREGREEVVVWGSGTPRRELLHVDDLADACLFLLRHYDDERPINVGTGRDSTIREIAELVRDVVAPGVRLAFDRTKPDGTPRKLLDVRRLERLGWRASIDLRAGIEETYRWFLAEEAAGALPRARPRRAAGE